MGEHVFKLPDLGEGTVEAEIVEWLVRPGDSVREGQPIANLMTDKANVEVPAPVDGRVLRITGQPGERVPVGAELAAFETTAAQAERSVPQQPTGKSALALAATLERPEVKSRPQQPKGNSESVLEPRDGPAPFSPRMRTRSSEVAPTLGVRDGPASLSPESPASTVPGMGTESNAKVLAEAAGQASTTDAPGTGRAPSAKTLAGAAGPDSTTQAPGIGKASSARVLTSPSIRRQAKEQGVDLSLVPGSGPCGRILRKDFDAYLAAAATAVTPADGGDAAPVPRQVQEVKLVGVRGAIARRMAQAKREIPHFTYVEEVDVTELEALRRQLNAEAGQDGLSLLPFVCFALLRALPEFPQCNACYDSASGILKRYPWVHLGIAVHTAQGLKVPVLKNAHQLDFRALAKAVAEAAAAARGNRLTPGELSGSTITVSSLGKLGGIVSTPIINYPEVAVIGVNRAVKRAVVIDDQVAVRLMMNLSSSFDHRFIDGHEAASLIARIRALLEHPALPFMAS